ncbi:MAG TPA: LacI family DNA-binding transcriptional regulator, partial [Spirillospora sp.]|nr:LacI family DNA-binding transcriptional regulator [Spirillospora sp.]
PGHPCFHRPLQSRHPSCITYFATMTGTVSRVLNNSPQVSPETRERVLDTIQRLGFRPNQLARQLSRGTRVRSLGVISPFIADHSFVARLKGVQRALTVTDQDYDLIFYHVTTPARFHQRLLTITEQGSVEGLLLVVLEPTAEQRALMDEAGIIYVGINDHPIDDWPSVGADNVLGGETATCYLLQQGHTRIAYVGDYFPLPYGFSVSEVRYRGYARALFEHNIPLNPDYVQLGQPGRDAAYQLTRTLLNLPEPPTAIFSMSDLQALGCLAAIRDAGLNVPGDISLIGFDDIEISQLIGLTTVRQHLEQAGYMAMLYLLKLLGDTSIPESMDAVPELPPFEVIERQTTRPLAH